jgi:BlaI family penicillinase repressor
VETENLLSRVYKGSIGMMMSTLVKQRDLTKEEIRELYDILEGLEGRDGERENK